MAVFIMVIYAFYRPSLCGVNVILPKKRRRRAWTLRLYLYISLSLLSRACMGFCIISQKHNTGEDVRAAARLCSSFHF